MKFNNFFEILFFFGFLQIVSKEIRCNHDGFSRVLCVEGISTQLRLSNSAYNSITRNRLFYRIFNKKTASKKDVFWYNTYPDETGLEQVGKTGRGTVVP